MKIWLLNFVNDQWGSFNDQWGSLSWFPCELNVQHRLQLAH